MAPARGRGGVQSGVHREPEPDADARDAAPPEDTMSQPARTPADDPEVTAARPADDEVADDDRPRRRERIRFGETDDLLADVDTGVNENEFKW